MQWVLDDEMAAGSLAGTVSLRPARRAKYLAADD